MNTISNVAIPIAVCAVLLFFTSTAGGYCHTTTCDPATEDCGKPDENGCYTKGVTIGWRSRCLEFQVQRDSTEGIEFELFNKITEHAFRVWEQADCGGEKRPSIEFTNVGSVSCDRAEFNKYAGNSNIVMFRNKDWPYSSSLHTLAITTVTFGVNSGDIVDVDIEINAAETAFSTSDEHVTTDLQSVITHEVGHFLGLAHSIDPSATMFASYNSGSTSFRTLKPDDIAGICAAYPPGRKAKCTPEPIGGRQDLCGDKDPPSSSSHCSITGTIGEMSQSMKSCWPACAIIAVVFVSLRRFAKLTKRVTTGA